MKQATPTYNQLLREYWDKSLDAEDAEFWTQVDLHTNPDNVAKHPLMDWQGYTHRVVQETEASRFSRHRR